MPDTPYCVAIEKFAQKLKRTRLRDMDYLLKDHLHKMTTIYCQYYSSTVVPRPPEENFPPLNIEFKCIFDLEPEMFQKIKTFRPFQSMNFSLNLKNIYLNFVLRTRGQSSKTA